MYNLLRGEIYKLFISKCLYFCGVAVLLCTLGVYAMFSTADAVKRGELQNGNYGVTVSVEGELQEGSNLWDRFPIETFMEAAHGVMGLFILTAFSAIYMYDIYANGAIKNMVGKGYQRCVVFTSKYFATLLGCLVLEVLTVVSVIVCDYLFVGVCRVSADNLGGLLGYAGVQFLLEAAFASIVIMIGQICRNLGMSIVGSFGVMLFSEMVTVGINLILQYFKIEINACKYWITDLIGECSCGAMKAEFVVRAIICAIVWSALAFIFGNIHFRKVDVK